jgi:biotin operon repressor
MRKKRKSQSKSGPSRLYLIPVLSKALDILEILQQEKQPKSLEDIYQRTSISKTTVYRILKTFTHRGYVAQSENGLYRLVSRPRKVRFGFGGARKLGDRLLFRRRGFAGAGQSLRRRHRGRECQ